MVGLLLVTHGSIGKSLLEVVADIMPEQAERICVVDYEKFLSTEKLALDICKSCIKIDDGSGILVMTDLIGSTPDKIVKKIINTKKIITVSGVNLAMILKVLNYHDSPLTELAKVAIEGAKSSIIIRNDK